MAPNVLVLTGMMGTGKSTVGRLLAEHLGHPFYDLDLLIEESTGQSVAEIFESGGEDAFRQAEREAVAALARELGAGASGGAAGSSQGAGRGPTDDAASGAAAGATRGAIVASGGWTIADAESRHTLDKLGPIVCLTCSLEALRERLDASEGPSRPILEGAGSGSWSSGERLEALQHTRRRVYDSVPLQVETTSRTPDEVAQTVLDLVERTTGLTLSATPVTTNEGGYGVVVAAGLLDQVGTLLGARMPVAKACVVTDRVVGKQYAPRLVASLARAGIAATTLTIDPGEDSKTLTTVNRLYELFLSAGLERDDVVVALGGGVVGDTAGFAAATYLRGVPTAIVPTSLLAMVDSAIGGKTGVNVPQGKNLVGAFWHPRLVAVDPSLLVSLPSEHLAAGLAEVVKAGLIADVGLLERLESSGAPPTTNFERWSDIIRTAATVKAIVVSDDPLEKGRRITLNLGHTFAHAFETASGHRIPHGHAVAVGLVAASRLSTRLGMSDAALAERLERLLVDLGLPDRYRGPTAEQVLAAMAADKKRSGGRLRFVLPVRPGEVRVVESVGQADVRAVLAELREPDA